MNKSDLRGWRHGRKYLWGQHVVVEEKESLLCFIKSSTACSAGDKCFSLTAVWNPGILHPTWSHGVQLNRDSYVVDCHHKSIPEKCLKNLQSEDSCSQDKCFLQPQLLSKLSQRLPYQMYQTLLVNYQHKRGLVPPQVGLWPRQTWLRESLPWFNLAFFFS